jgi:2-dehydropantoate 2-reductase
VNVAIVGGGAMGGVWAARLAQAGHAVSVLDVSEEIVSSINANGLIVENKDGAVETVRLRATSRPEEIGPADVVYFFVKAQHTPSAAELAKPLVDDGTTLVSLQNGWGNSDVLAGVYPPGQIAMGVTYHSATVLGPGRVAHTNASSTFVGPYADGAPLDRAQAIGDAMTAAGIETTVTARIKTEVWKKLILNCATLPTSGLTRLRAGELGEPGPVLDVLDAITAEAVRVATALGYEIDVDERIDAIHSLLARGGAGKASMLQDVEAQRKTEIEVINGAVVREAEKVGIDVPINRAMVALINGLERSWRRAE